tara:strand:- start:49 stop:294 length:246 start_codon:yes stop_codon:yes gene_type:complete
VNLLRAKSVLVVLLVNVEYVFLVLHHRVVMVALVLLLASEVAFLHPVALRLEEVEVAPLAFCKQSEYPYLLLLIIQVYILT